jgi:hypothetical protein
MLKLNAGFSRKIGEPNYGSRGASVNVELEVESNLISDPDGLMGRIRNLFALAKRAVDAELQTGPADDPNTATPGRSSRAPQNNRPVDGDTIRYATASQVRAIRAICGRQGINPQQLANDRFQVADLDELTLREASALIDELKGAPTNGRKGGGR